MTNIAKGGSRDKREMKFRNRAMPSRILYSTFYKYRKEQKQKQINPFVFFARKTKIYDIEKKNRIRRRAIPVYPPPKAICSEASLRNYGYNA